MISAGGVGGWVIAGTLVRHRSVRHTEPPRTMAEESSGDPRESENRQKGEGKQALRVWHDCGLTSIRQPAEAYRRSLIRHADLNSAENAAQSSAWPGQLGRRRPATPSVLTARTDPASVSPRPGRSGSGTFDGWPIDRDGASSVR